MHLALIESEDFDIFKAEVQQSYSDFVSISDCICSFEGDLKPESLAFARQILPEATLNKGESISDFVEIIYNILIKLEANLYEKLSLHIFAVYPDSRSAGQRRAEIIKERLLEVLKKKRRSVYKKIYSDNSPFEESSALLQVLMISPDQAYISYSPPYFCFNHRSIISHIANGRGEFFPDKLAPSRAFLKLLAAIERLGIDMLKGESVVDLGASPGGWSYVALNKGAFVTAVDRSELTPELMKNVNMSFIKGNAFSFLPDKKVDWLICDLIAFPDKTLELLKSWVDKKLMDKFIVTFKFKGQPDIKFIQVLKNYLSEVCAHWVLNRLEFNKNEITAMGQIK